MKKDLHIVGISCIMKLRLKKRSKGDENMQQEKLASIRRSRNISQREVAEVVGIATETYNNKELGKTQFKASEMFIIADFFGKTVDEIFLPPNFMIREVEKV